MRRTWGCLILSVGALWAGARPVLAAEDRLDSPHAVDWRGVPLRAVLDELSGDLRVPYMLDGSVSPETADRRLRLFAAHLTGRQAFRWAARLAGLEAVIRDGMVLVAPPEKLPLLWRLTGGGMAANAGGEESLGGLAQRRASIEWVDAPLSSVGRDVSSKFGVDLVFHPDILSEEGLVHLESAEASLDEVRAATEDQLKARTEFYDGALWVVPVALAPTQPTTRPSGGSQPSSRAELKAAAGPLDQFVMLDHSVTSWQELCDRLSRAAGVVCRIRSPGGAFGAPVEARGTVGEVLDAARLLGRLEWRQLPAREGGAAGLEIRPGRGAK